MEAATLPLLGLGRRELTSTLQPAAHPQSNAADADSVIQEAADTAETEMGSGSPKHYSPLHSIN